MTQRALGSAAFVKETAELTRSFKFIHVERSQPCAVCTYIIKEIKKIIFKTSSHFDSIVVGKNRWEFHMSATASSGSM